MKKWLVFDTALATIAGMSRLSVWLGKLWRVIRWPVWVLLALVVGLVVWRFPVAWEKQKTELKILREDFNGIDQRVADLEGKFEEINTVSASF